MKIKRFFAADIRQAMRMVKDELGSDAVIMSNKSVDGGVEIFAARDLDLQAEAEDVPGNQQTAQKQPAINKLFELPDYAAEKDHLHIVSSPRKQVAAQETLAKQPRRDLDSYLGYAEKAFLNGSNVGNIEAPVNKVSTNKSAPLPVMNVDFSDTKYSASKAREREFVAQHHAPPMKPVETKSAIKTPQHAVGNDLLMEMLNEFKQLKLSMASRLAETHYANNMNNNPVRLDVLHRLADMGISKKLGLKLASRVEGMATGEAAFKKAQELMSKILPVSEDDVLNQGGFIALVGPTGVGKTTTIAKLAAKFILKHGPRQVALITMDNFRIGAHEQLSTYARILDVPVRSAANAQELRKLMNGFFDKKLILIDTAGMGPKDIRLAQQLMALQEHDISVKPYLVMSATTQYKAMQSIIQAFQMVEPTACIITKLDEADSKGAIISTLIERQLPVAFIADGQQVPEDIHVPNARRLIEQCVAELEVGFVSGYEDWVTKGYA